MRPSARAVRLCAALFALGVGAALWAPLQPAWAAAGLGLLALAAVDAARPSWRRAVHAERRAPSSFALGVPTEVRLRLSSDAGRPLRAQVFDGIPPEGDSPEQPTDLVLPAEGFVDWTYDLRMQRRGPVEFGPTELRVRSPLGLWTRRVRAGAGESVRVLPNFAPVVRYALLALSHRLEQMGIKKRQRRGLGKSFHQLREYREGDLLQQIDWKATARRRELVSREYQEERDQQILLVLDCGRRMRAQDGELAFFDHALNASLLLTYVALRQGDSVGLMAFSGADRWLPPVKGQSAVSTVLEALHDLEPSEAPSDFEEAARRILVRQRRRALVVLLTNLRGEDSEDLQPAVRLLRRRHLVVVASLREPVVDEALRTPVTDLESAVALGAAAHYTEARTRVVEGLRGAGVPALDLLAKDLPVALANEYLAIKQAGTL